MPPAMENWASLTDSIKRKSEGKRSHTANLHSQLYDSLQCEENNPSFLPIDALEHIITKDAVTQELKKHWPERPSELLDNIASDICRHNVVRGRLERLKFSSCQRLFALLVLCEKVPDVVNLLAHGINDEDLPFTRQENDGFLYSSKIPKKKITIFDEWSPMLISLFKELQWKLLAPYFSNASSSSRTEIRHYDLKTRDVLPRVGIRQHVPVRFINLRSLEPWVDIYKLHPSHHDFQLPNVSIPCP